MSEEPLTVKEYAALWRLNVNSVYTAIRKERMPYPVERPLGGSVRIRVPADVIAKLRAA